MIHSAMDDSDDELEVPKPSSFSPRRSGSGGGGNTSASTFGGRKSPFSSQRQSGDSEEEEEEDDDVDGGDSDEDNDDDDDVRALEGPDVHIVEAAAALAADGIPEITIEFSREVVGPMGAGFLWPLAPSESSPDALERFGLAPPSVHCLSSAGMFVPGERVVVGGGTGDDVEELVGVFVSGSGLEVSCSMGVVVVE